MTIKTTVWLTKSDKAIKSAIMSYGMRKLGRNANISPAMLSRWRRGQVGMSWQKYKRVAAMLHSLAPAPDFDPTE